jgi:hypothetical protein
METRIHRWWLLGAFVAALAALALPALARANAIPVPADVCYDVNVDCGSGEGDSGVVAESWAAYSFARGTCRTRWARATRRNYAWVVVYRYNEQVRWCWSGGVITYFDRDRWPSDTRLGWAFDRHVAGNCVLERCTGRGVGTYSTDAWTQGQFHVCVGWYCTYKYPVVDIWVHGDGGSGASWSGA